MSSKSLLLSVGSISFVGAGVYVIYTSTQSNNKKVEIPDVVNDLDYWLWKETSSSSTIDSTKQDKSTDSKK